RAVRPVLALAADGRLMSSSMFDWNRPETGARGPDRGLQAALGASERAQPLQGWQVAFGQHARGFKVVPETPRSGLQRRSGGNPPVSHKVDLLHAMARLGVDVVSVGLPAAGGQYAEDSYVLCREIASQRLPLLPTAAARTVPTDVIGIARTAERAG